MEARNKELTILMVAGPGDEQFVRANVSYINNLNQEAKLRIIVIDNGREAAIGGGIRGEIRDVEIIPGQPPNMELPASCRGSYHHAAALNDCLATVEINTKYILILDPDFYILRAKWIQEVLSHMADNNLGFFGSPWHPKWYSKFRNFPCQQCMFIDLSLIDIEDIDFRPNLKIPPGNPSKKQSVSKVTEITKKEIMGIDTNLVPAKFLGKASVWRLLAHMVWKEFKNLEESYISAGLQIPFSYKCAMLFLRLIGKIIRAPKFMIRLFISLTLTRRHINSSQDTSYRIHEKFGRSSIKTRILKPMVNLKEDFKSILHLRFKLGRLTEMLLPDRWAYLPQKRDYFVSSRFRDHGLPDLARHNWEEFFWKEEPFAFHLRRFNKKQRDVDMELKQISETMEKAFTLNK